MAREVSLGTSGMVKINGSHGLLGEVPASEMSNRISTFRPTGSIGLKCGPVFHADVVLLMLDC